MKENAKKQREKSLLRESIANIKKCFKFLDGVKREYFLIIFLGVLLSIIYCLVPYLTGNLITQILGEKLSKALQIIAILIVIKVFSLILSIVLSKLYYLINKKMIFNIRKTLSQSLVNYEMKNFTNNNSGYFINKIKDDPNQIVSSFNLIKDLILRIVWNLAVIVYTFYLSWQIGLVLVLFIALALFIKMIGVKKSVIIRKKFLSEQEKFSSMLQEMISGMIDIKTLDLKKAYVDKTEDVFSKTGELEYQGSFYQQKYNKLADFIQNIAIYIIAVVGIYLMSNNILQASPLIIILMYKSKIFVLVDSIINLIDTIFVLNISCVRVFSLLKNHSKEEYGVDELKDYNGCIEFKKVEFSYGSYKVLDKCSFKINSFGIYPIVGKSGEGKTTILNLIAKIYFPNKGKVLIGDKDVSELSEEFLRSNISVVTQEPYLFDMSIKDNFALVDESATLDTIKQLCKEVGLDDYFESLPNKYDTIIGPGAIQLSTGQKQRLAIARTLLKNTPIILLDEITSSLDGDAGNNIKNVIDKIKKDHVIIFVTHDLSIVKEYPNIFVLNNGKIEASGSHNELIKKSKIYKELYKNDN